MDEQRIYFTRGSKEMRKAVEYVTDNNWLDAAGYWQLVIQKPQIKPETAAKAAFNLAVANEMEGNFDMALEWLNKSSEKYPIPEEPWYRKLLELRIKLLERL
jgi:tetratricopeptide (TPR) repeat protein